MATSMIMFLPLILCISGIVGEPQCSPFHYHEQLLERMIDVKYKMDLLTNKMDKWETVISEKLEKIDARFQEQDNKIEDRWRKDIENQRTYFNETLADFSQKWKQNNAVVESTKTPRVLFKARAVKNRDPTYDETVIFQTIVQNEGNGYNADTGIFTVPVAGNYLFTTQFGLFENKELSVNIVADGMVVTAANFGDKDWSYITTSTDGTATLQQGDHVMVKVTHASAGEVIYRDVITRHWNYFSGLLIRLSSSTGCIACQQKQLFQREKHYYKYMYLRLDIPFH